jgi:hypothetical protein
VPTKKVVRKRRPRGSGNYPIIAARLPPDIVSQVEQYAKQHKISRSEAIVAILRKGLEELK